MPAKMVPFRVKQESLVYKAAQVHKCFMLIYFLNGVGFLNLVLAKY